MQKCLAPNLPGEIFAQNAGEKFLGNTSTFLPIPRGKISGKGNFDRISGEGKILGSELLAELLRGENFSPVEARCDI